MGLYPEHCCHRWPTDAERQPVVKCGNKVNATNLGDRKALSRTIIPAVRTINIH